MTRLDESQSRLDSFAALLDRGARELRAEIARDPARADELVAFIQRSREAAFELNGDAPADDGLSTMIGIGPDAANDLGEAFLPSGISQYDEMVPSDRLTAIADLYYLYQHERLGVFRAVNKLKQLFRAGKVRLSDGDGAFRLYRFDRREVLRFTTRDRAAAYYRVFGYGPGPGEGGAQPNSQFHRLFTRFNREVAEFWRDKRISNVIRDGADNYAFGSIAIVRRSGFDLRNNLKFASYGHVNVLRTEVMELLREAFNILSAPDVRAEFASDTGWDALEEILTRYFNEHLSTSPRQRMAKAGQELLRWLAQPYVLESDRVLFETSLLQVADQSEEWLTSAESVGAVRAVRV